MPTILAIDHSSRVLVTGHRGLIGSAVVQRLRHSGYKSVLTVEPSDVDLTDLDTTTEYLRHERPDAIVHAAALVGGIQANTARPADFITRNLLLQTSVIHGAHLAGIQHLIFFGSNCMYPSTAPNPLIEGSLLSGPIEKSNLAYGAAKIAGYVQTQAYVQQYGRRYICVIPASLFGPNDNFSPDQSHVTPALILRFYLAQLQNQPSVTLWGTGKPRRELLYSLDAARGVQFLLENYDAQLGPINMGAGTDHSIAEIAAAIAQVSGFSGAIEFDTTRPDGAFQKLLDSSKLRTLGFSAQTPLEQALRETYLWLKTAPSVRGVSAETLHPQVGDTASLRS